ncbi:ABC-type transport auxiliary lipoprotein family protein [Acidiferrobacter sp.]|jgi:ABC-type uncharacterized transport system auxiliary subunit|uniref:ABC-type transport auxiliary lipoprotein family protein n=2 Tax=Acidiferrobacter sp. TaxID=1872107 RepID=UPI002620FF2A|nr:ABC-type transport auxiliary lipoprotein family protein [Acidiferrobacter sp.]
MAKTLRIFVVTLAVIGLAGCTLFPARAPQALTVHDFGPLRAHTPTRDMPPVIVRVQAVAWLSGTTIHYRLLYRDPTAVHVYAQNRWIAPPASLLKARIRWRLGMGSVFAARPSTPIERLVIVLSRFDQDFTTPHRAFVRLDATARLYDGASARVLAQKTVDLKRRCAPDAQGAVMGLSRLARQASAAFARLVTHHAR